MRRGWRREGVGGGGGGGGGGYVWRRESVFISWLLNIPTTVKAYLKHGSAETT